MFNLHFGRTRGTIVAVADIGGGSAAFAVVSVALHAPARVLAAERLFLTLEERSTEATVAALGELLIQAGQKVLKLYNAEKNAAPVEKAYCIVAAPWSRSKSARAAGHFSEPRVITKSVIATLAKQALADEHELDHQRLLEAAVVRVELNGYETREPEKKTAQRIAVSALITDCDTQLRATATAALATLLPHLSPVFRSSTRALLRAVREFQDHEEDRIIVEIARVGTTLTTIYEGSIGQQHLLSEGIGSILKRLSPSGMPEETMSLIRMLGRDQCSSAACEEMQNAMAKIEPDLVRSFAEGLSACAATRKLPTKLMLSVERDFLPWLSKFFTRIDFTQFTVTTQPFSVEALTAQELSQSVIQQGHVPLDAALALSVALVNREQGEEYGSAI